MHRLFFVAMTILVLIICDSRPTAAQTSAPSSHFVFDDNFDGDIIINEVRVPKAGEATFTYYEALGWRGKGAGYAGIQAHPKAHLYIFSIWDHKEHTAPIKAVYRGPGTETVGFGGEGTGLKSWNFDLGWSTDVWYTLVARNWPVAEHTHYGFWARAGDTGQWTHLVTMDVAAADASFQGGTDAFIEDWSNTGDKPRTTQLRGGWKRKTDGTWHPFGGGRYSVNAWDLERGKRSFDYRKNWNGGVASDETGEFYFMTSGGAETRPTTTNPSEHKIEHTAPEPNYETTIVSQVKAKMQDAKTLAVSWEVDKSTTPPFSYHIQIFDNASGQGKPLASVSDQVPHARAATVDVSGLKSAEGHFVQLYCLDVFDRKSEVQTVPISSSK